MEIWSLFSGALGLDLGLERAGLKPTLAIEKNSRFCETIRLNRPDLDLIEGDLCNFTALDLRRHRNYAGDVFLMVGGPPCQSFSPGGKRAGLADPRGNLIYEYLRLVDDVRPKLFVFENVANLITVALRHRKIEDRPGKHWNLKNYRAGQIHPDDDARPMEPDELSGSAIRRLLKDVETLGYSIVFGVINAADYGSAQNRLRFIMFGSRDHSAPSLPRPTHGPGNDDLKPYRILRNVIWDLRSDPGMHSSYTPPMAHFFSLVPAGGNWRNLPDSLKREAMGGAYNSGGGKTGFFRRLSWDELSPTIIGRANRKGSAMCHPEFIRPLSVRECARIQGFPDDWDFSGSMNQQYQQVGNAVPVELGEAIGKSILADNFEAKREESMEVMLAAALKRLRASARNKRSRKKFNLDLFQ